MNPKAGRWRVWVALWGLCVWCAMWGCEDSGTSLPPPPPSSIKGDFQIYDEIPSAAAMPAAPSTKLVPLRASSREYETHHFTGSKRCATCHDEARDTSGKKIPIVTDWSATIMANAARDPYWQAQVASEIKRAPTLEAALTQKCGRCHAPLAMHESKYQKKPLMRFAEALLSPTHALFDLVMAGVSCTLCHQIKDTPALGTPAGSSGGFEIETFSSIYQRKIYGPFADVLRQPMRDNVMFIPTGSDHIRDAKLCATCHDLKTAFVDQRGVIVPKQRKDYFPEQMTYSEWKRSRFANKSWLRSCQWCHMEPVRDVKLSYGPPWLKPRDYIRRHAFAGANVFMLRMLRDNRKVLGVQDAPFDQTIKRAAGLMSAGVTLSVPEKVRRGSRLTFRVQVENKAGHKYPTGYPMRRAFLYVLVKDAQGKRLFESGRVLQDGHIVGVDADLDAAKYEPHYDRITRPDQVQIYESVMADTSGAVTYTLLRAARYKKDNRLLPAGFVKADAPRDVQVVGEAAKDENFQGGRDVVTYDLNGFPDGRLTVEIAFRYQSISYRAALDLFRDRSLPLVGRFLALYKAAPRFVETVATTTFSVP